MRSVLLAVVILCAASAPALAGVDLALGLYGGMYIPVATEDADLGPLFGVQTRLAFWEFVAIGAHYQNSQLGNPEQTFFEGQPGLEFTDEKDGGSIQSFAGDLYLGKVGGGGFNFYLVGSIGTFQWNREQGDITKPLYAAGLGFEINLPIHLGVEFRSMFEVSPFDEDLGNGSGSYKSVTWFIGGNYHFGTPAP